MAFWGQNSQNPSLQVQFACGRPVEVGTHHPACTDAPAKLGAGAGSCGAKDATPGGKAGVAVRAGDGKATVPCPHRCRGSSSRPETRSPLLEHLPCAVSRCWPHGRTQWGDMGGFNGASPLIAALMSWSIWCWGRVSGVNRDIW